MYVCMCMYIWLLWGLAADSSSDSAPGNRCGTFDPKPSVPTLPPNSGYTLLLGSRCGRGQVGGFTELRHGISDETIFPESVHLRRQFIRRGLRRRCSSAVAGPGSQSATESALSWRSAPCACIIRSISHCGGCSRLL